MQCCTCLGSCKGPEGLAPGWYCALKAPSGNATVANEMGQLVAWYELLNVAADALMRAKQIAKRLGHEQRAADTMKLKNHVEALAAEYLGS